MSLVPYYDVATRAAADERTFDPRLPKETRSVAYHPGKSHSAVVYISIQKANEGGANLIQHPDDAVVSALVHDIGPECLIAGFRVERGQRVDRGMMKGQAYELAPWLPANAARGRPGPTSSASSSSSSLNVSAAQAVDTAAEGNLGIEPPIDKTVIIVDDDEPSVDAGSSILATCATCGEEMSAARIFCLNCGRPTPLALAATTSEQQDTVAEVTTEMADQLQLRFVPIASAKQRRGGVRAAVGVHYEDHRAREQYKRATHKGIALRDGEEPGEFTRQAPSGSGLRNYYQSIEERWLNDPFFKDDIEQHYFESGEFTREDAARWDAIAIAHKAQQDAVAHLPPWERPGAMDKYEREARQVGGVGHIRTTQPSGGRNIPRHEVEGYAAWRRQLGEDNRAARPAPPSPPVSQDQQHASGRAGTIGKGKGADERKGKGGTKGKDKSKDKGKNKHKDKGKGTGDTKGKVKGKDKTKTQPYPAPPPEPTGWGRYQSREWYTSRPSDIDDTW